LEVHQPLSKSIDDDPQQLPILLNPAMQTFRDSPQSATDVFEHAIELRSGMPVDVSQHDVPLAQTL
jgi:L,D-transpeptidase YcfS